MLQNQGIILGSPAHEADALPLGHQGGEGRVVGYGDTNLLGECSLILSVPEPKQIVVYTKHVVPYITHFPLHKHTVQTTTTKVPETSHRSLDKM